MKQVIFGLALISIGLGLSDPAEDYKVVYQDHYDSLKAEHPYASEQCLTIAANIKIGNYDAISDMMPTKDGRCAVRVLDLIVRVN